MIATPTIGAVLFDFSGTLFDDTSVIDGTRLAAAARRRGEALGPEEAAALGRRIQEHASSAEGRRARAGCDRSSEIHRELWTSLAASTEGVSRPVAESFYDCIVDPDAWQPYPDVRATLLALRAGGIRVAVVSNTGWDIRQSFVRTGLYELVDVFVLSCEHAREKPDPALFHLACELLAVAPADALMVGDDPAADGPAITAGLSVYLLRAQRGAGQPRGLHRVVSLCGLVPGRARVREGSA